MNAVTDVYSRTSNVMYSGSRQTTKQLATYKWLVNPPYSSGSDRSASDFTINVTPTTPNSATINVNTPPGILLITVDDTSPTTDVDGSSSTNISLIRDDKIHCVTSV
jgi:hypothetical protein